MHRRELLQQTRRTLWEMYKIEAQIIVAGMRTIPAARVYVGMVESVNRRVLQIPVTIGLLIVDEAHRAEFNKIHRHFAEALTIGFTATPLAASRKNPLKKYYNDIVCCIDIKALIQQGALVQNITYSPQEQIERANLKLRGDDFDANAMASAFSKQRYVQSVVDSYKKLTPNTKAIVFNCGVEHSKLVCAAFIGAGYNARHVDAGSADRDRTMAWFKTTPDAILCNCDIATVGLDVPDIETVIVNRATTSLPLWLQMCGRGSRPAQNKTMFTIIDMGGNAITLNDWNYAHDWNNIFWNPARPGKGNGVAPAAPVCCQY